MGIEQELTEKLKEAMKARRTEEISVLRMVKTQATKDRTASGFDGNTGDEFWLGVIERYVKQQKKSLAEFESLGQQDSEQVADLKFEIEYLKPFLPELLSEDQVAAAVENAIAETGADSIRMMGKVVGAVMKAHKGKVDPALVKQLVQNKLG